MTAAQHLTIRIEERWITCCMCGEESDHTEPADRRGVPIWNGAPTTSNAAEVDGYMPTCARCYLRWDSWDDRMRSNASIEPHSGPGENENG